MPISYTQEQANRAYEKLPEELQEAIFSVETADAIHSACEKQKVLDERVGEIAKHAGYVLMGLELPDELLEVLQKEIKLPKKAAEAINHEINRFVFFPVRSALEQLHRIEIKPVSKSIPKPRQELRQELEEEEREEEEPRQQPKGPDAYRETIE